MKDSSDTARSATAAVFLVKKEHFHAVQDHVARISARDDASFVPAEDDGIATNKRELFARLADHLTALASDVERAMKEASTAVRSA